MQNRKYGKFHLTLFSSARQESMYHLKFIKLSDFPQYLNQAASWSSNQWNYLAGLSSFEDYKKDIDKCKDSIYILMLFNRDIKNVLLIHMNSFTAEMLDALLTSYKKQNVRFISLTDALTDDVYQRDLKILNS